MGVRAMDDKEKKPYPTRFSLIWHFLRGSKRYFILAIIFALGMQMLALVNPKIIRYTVDTVIGNEKSSLPSWADAIVGHFGGVPWLREHLWAVALAVIVTALCTALVRFLFRWTNQIGAETLVKTIRDDLYEHITGLPYSWFHANHTGDIIQRCTSDVETIKMFLSEQLTSLVRIVVIIVLALYYMFGLHRKLALYSALFIPVIIAYSLFFHSKIGSSFRHADEEEGRLSAIAQENLTGVRVVRAFNKESYERARFEKQNRKYTKMWVSLMRLMAAFFSMSDFVSGLQILLVTALGAYYCVMGQMSAGSYIAFISYNAMLTWPVRQIGRVIAQISKAGISIDRLAYIMNSPVEEDHPDDVTPDMHGDIVFDHVSFKYDETSDGVLHDVSLRIPAGSTLGIIGATGSGKSTLADLLDRLYDLGEGEGRILIGDTDIRHIRRQWLRQNIGMVLQEPYLFSRRLADNIRIARPSSSMDEVRSAARIADLDETVGKFAEGYDTYVGERGVTLSGGQKQRTAIAQMLIRKPPIMIFDDSLSAVDAETDAKIRAALRENTGDSTVILIAHRLSTVMKADQILVLDRGRAVEMGTHEELLQAGGIYRKIYDLQAKEDA